MLPIHERFHTFQGEGDYMGHAAFFIRTFGCPVHCDFCDSAGTWHPNYIPKHVTKMEPATLVEEARLAGVGIAVITGGEPAVHDLSELCFLLRIAHIRPHLETSGAYQIRGNFDWVTVSPKRAKLPLRSSLELATEYKLIIEKPDDIDYWEQMLTKAVPHNATVRSVWLHPEWSQRDNPEVLNAITNAVKARKLAYRAGWQLHKLYKSDALDNRAAPLVPLGGDPTKGY